MICAITQYRKAIATEKNDNKYRLRMELYHNTMLRWIELIQDSKSSLAGFLKECGYNSAAVYGLNDLGILLVNNLIKEDYPIAYALDQSANNRIFRDISIPVVVPGKANDQPKVDVVIICALNSVEEIETTLLQFINTPTIPIDELIALAQR